MEHLLFFFSFNFLLISRLGLLFRDSGADYPDLIKMTAIALIPLAFLEMNTGWLILVVYLFLSIILTRKLENNEQNRNRNRLIVLVIHLLIYIIIFSSFFSMNENQLFTSFHKIAAYLLPFTEQFTPKQLLNAYILTFGFLMILLEANTLLRYFLKVSGLKSLAKEDPDVNDFKTGRVIGILERIFIFLFALANQFAAIGFIITAKGVIRFKEFENRSFAEYVLIGTLFSTLIALVIALFIKSIVF